MNRRLRSRLLVVVTAGTIGVLSPVWGPVALRNVPIFGVEDVRVRGAHFVPAEQIRALAAFGPEASVWDDMRPIENRLAEHPLLLEASVRRAGIHRVDVVIREVQPVAFVSTPELVPVDAAGRALALDPAGSALDLPILVGADVTDGRVEPEAARLALEVLDQVSALDSAFTRRISEIRPLRGTSVEFLLLPGSPLDRVVLPIRDAAAAFLRVGSAVSLAEARGPVREADARYENEVVIRMGRSQ
ncbi:MAG TPA: FtsQ-type POTRA domain-containing protein [Gemmatimonadota bacterium]|nr:FtsQ-type POTRA domain-containing protein [Gemmatimonadota bacterium]